SRLWIHQTLEIMGNIGRRLQGRRVRVRSEAPTVFFSNAPPLLPFSPTQDAANSLRPVLAAQGKPDQILLDGLRVALPGLAAGVSDPDVRVRRATIDVLETLGQDAKPEAPALARALADSDVFVRWAAARTLGKLAPVEADTAVPGLVRLLCDRDSDVRQTAAEALRRYGPAAQGAVPALLQAVAQGEPDTRLASLRALEGIGASASTAIPVLVVALGAPEARIRQAAAQLLGRCGPDARDAAEALRAVLSDHDDAVRRAASDALLEVLPPPGASLPMTGQAPTPIWRAAHLGAPAPVVPAA